MIYIAYSFFSVKRRKSYVHNLFSIIIISSICNLLFDIATVYTVNHLETVPPSLNHLLHILFVGSTAAVVFCIYLYVRSLVYPKIEHPLGKPISWIPFVLAILCISLLPIHYDRGPHTNYSSGLAVNAAYACIIFYFIRCLFLLIRFRKTVNKRQMRGIVTAILTISVVTSIQAIISESLFSSVGIVMLNLAFFFTVENPDTALMEQLAYAKNKADEANKAKTNFLANMSHEIRTPINAVLGMDEMIIRETKDEQIKNYALNIKTAGANLLDIINEILDFSKIEAGKMELISENYDVASIVVDLFNMISERAEKKGLTLKINANPEIPRTLYGDSLRIKQCILNLLTNAVKYTKEGTVTFTIDYKKYNKDSIDLMICVADTGIGIKPEDMERLFSPFERLDEGRNRSVEGTGLGMNIVKKTLALMNSKIEVKSTYGQGSEFSFSIKQEVTDWTPLGDIKKSFKINAKRLDAYKESLIIPKVKLLFVDDTEMNLEVVKGLLKNTGATIDTVLSGKEALEKVKTTCYDILFIDHRMPEMDGIETLHIMQNMPDNLSKGKPCIALTANAISGVNKMYMNEGFIDYLPKPVDPEKLEDMIQKYIPQDLIEKRDLNDNLENQNPKLILSEESKLISRIRAIQGLDFNKAIDNCAKLAILKKAIIMYYNSIDENINELQNLLESNNLRVYCVKVHALKSTSRLIGIEEIGAKAEYLEKSAAEYKKEDVLIEHQNLTALLRLYKTRLETFAAEN